MSNDAMRRIQTLRTFHYGRQGGSSSEMVRELQQIKSELRILNDESAKKTEPITNATNSPYLTDQNFHNPAVILNSPTETEWKEVKSAEQLRQEVLRKLNIV